MSDSLRSAAEPGRKRKRLTHACSSCRARKIRCDEARPRCTNCERAGAQCITLDPRNPGVPVERREAQRPYPETSHVSQSSTASSVPHTYLRADPVPQANLLSNAQASHTTPAPDACRSPNSELLPALPRHSSGYGNSLSMLSQWLELAFFRLGIPRSPGNESPKVTRTFSRKRWAVNIADALSRVPSTEIYMHTQTYMGSINTVFPIFTPKSMEQLILHWDSSSQIPLDGKVHDAAHILMALVIAANVQMSQPALAATCLDVALCNLQYILDNPSITSIKTLFLLSLIHRCRDDIFLASNMVSLAASFAQTLGLHRHTPRRQTTAAGSDRSQEYISIWWSVFVLEKVISMEVGRISSIRDFECNQTPPLTSELILALIDLARLQSDINENFALSRHMEESNTDVDIVIGSKMKMIGELDQKLLDWTRSLPPYAQPLSNTVDDPELRYVMPFLASQYWQTLFTLHRNALLLNHSLVTTSADKYCAETPYRLRIKNGHGICCNAARMIASIVNDVYEHEAVSVLGSSYAPLTAAYALGIHLLKNPQLGLAKADFEIQASAAKMVAKHQSQIGTHDDLDSQALRSLLDKLHTEVTTRLDGHLNVATENRTQDSTHTPSSSDRVSTLERMEKSPCLETVTPATVNQTVAPALLSSLDYSTQFDMSAGRIDLDSTYDSIDAMNLDWEALALAYDLPSQ